MATVLYGLEADLRAGIVPITIATGFPGLTKCLSGGFSPGELTFVAASAGTGKTAFALEIARAAAKTGENVLVVSREMRNLALARRLLAQEARVGASRLKAARLGPGEWVLLEKALAQLCGLNIWLTDMAVTLEQIEHLIRQAIPPYDLLIVDYLQLVRVPGAKDKREQVEAAAQALKGIAMTHGLPVICLSSIRRMAGGPDQEPTKDVLRESGELEHCADIILLLHRKFEAQECACIVAKNRDGWEGRVQLVFRKEYVAFEEREERPEE